MTSTLEFDLPTHVLARLRAARNVMTLTGAGISAESGIATFRAPGTGLWSRFDPSELATPDGWARNPRLVWSWYTFRRLVAAQAQPNAGHLALVQLASFYERFSLVTQNVDGLHSRAGSGDVVELHGNIGRFRCTREGVVVEYADAEDAAAMLEALERGEQLDVPECSRCGALLRPDVVWFGETLPGEALERASIAAAMCDACLVVGTSALVYPAAGLPLLAKRNGACVVEINPEETELSNYVDASLRGQAGVALPWLVERITATAE